MGRTFYETLGVRQGANPAEIDLAYKTLAQVSDLDIETQLEVSVAYQTLIHPSRRSEYDQTVNPMPQKTDEALRAQEQVLSMIRQWRPYTPPAPEVSPTNKVLTTFLLFYILAFAAMSVFGLVALTL